MAKEGEELRESDPIVQAQSQTTKKPLKKGSKDDFDVVYHTPLPSKEEKRSGISRFFSYIIESKAGKVLFGTALSRGITIVFTTAVLSGIFPPAIPFAVTAAIISLTAVAVGAIVDTIRTRSLRKLAEESDLLVKNRTALSKQEYILQNLNPELSEILKDQLDKPEPQQHRKDKDYIGSGKTANVSQVLLDSVPSAANLTLNSIIAVATGNPVEIAKAISAGTMTAAALIGGGAVAKSAVNVAKGLKLHINEERLRTKKYKNVDELRKNVRKQEIQSMALEQLLQDKDYFKFTPEEKRAKFQELTETLKKQQSQPVAKKSDSILSDLGRAHDPFYVQPTLKPNSGLTKAMASEKAEESVRSIITPRVRDSFLSKKAKFDDGLSSPRTKTQTKKGKAETQSI